MAAMIVSASVTGASAQQIRSAYFMEKSVARTSLNPAFVPERGFVTIPIIGSFGASFGTNGVAANDFIYNRNGKNITFLDSSIPAEDFLGRIKDNNSFNMDFSTDLLRVGWFGMGGFCTVETGIRTNFSINVPKSMFELIKMPIPSSGTVLDIKNFDLDLDIYNETALGYARSINDRLTVGGKFKLLLGLGNINMHVENMRATENGDTWDVISRGSLDVSMRGLCPKTKMEDGVEYIDKLELGSMGISGVGAGIDLGVSYKLLDNLTISGAILDLGFISWGKKSNITALSDEEINFEGFQDNGGSAGDQFDNIADGFKDLVRLRTTEQKGRSTSLRTTINVGAEYTILDNLLGFGLLSSTKFYKPVAYTELTAVATVRPANWFTGALSYSFIHSKFKTFGLALNFNAPGFNFLVGSDYVLTSVNKGVPQTVNGANIYLGMAITFGKPKSL